MAANFWASTQRRHWLFSREKLAETRDRLRDRDKVTHSQFPLPDQRLLNIYFNQRKQNDISFCRGPLLMISQNLSNWESACPLGSRPSRLRKYT